MNFRSLLLVSAVAASSASFFACEGCRGGQDRTPLSPPGEASVEAASPTARLYVVSDPAGALEPCGCVKDQLGGLDHVAAWIEKERARAPHYGLLSAGPLFFMDTELAGDRRGQDLAKADALAKSFSTLKLLAFAPGKNDFAAGPETLQRLALATGGDILLANVDGAVPSQRRGVIKTINGIKFGIIGVSAAKDASRSAADAVASAAKELKAEGANVLVAVAAVGRGEAKRIADACPELAAIVVGSAGGNGEANTKTPPAERVGNVIIAETGNHLQTVVALDFFVKDKSYLFADATGLERQQKAAELTRRIDELTKKLEAWEKDSTVSKEDIAARRIDLGKLEQERIALRAKVPGDNEKKSSFQYEIREVREALGSDPAIKAELGTYYKTVNEQNKRAFADRKPRVAGVGEASYVGVTACAKCHEEPKKVWDGTAHARAYKTLSDQSKEFNLDCVSCHVTGYDKPGGSTVTFVDKLKDVQCETCHGPGSLHAANPKRVKPLTAKPSEELCASCHHPPHVIEFDAKAKMGSILGPGHGL